MTGSGVAVYLVLLVLNFFEIELGAEQVQVAVEAIAVLASTVMLVWGQLRRKDLKFGVVRKEKMVN